MMVEDCDYNYCVYVFGCEMMVEHCDYNYCVYAFLAGGEICFGSDAK
jgi:hypothetical protein